MAACPFCSITAERIWIENADAIAVADSHPVSNGHTLVAPRKHVGSIYDLEIEEQSAIWTAAE